MAAMLVVDDERDIARILSEFLEDRGHDVATAHSGSEALEIAHHQSFDVVFLDIVMPDPDGIETLRRLKSEFPETIVIMISGLSDERRAVEALDLGAFDYIRKPFDFRHLERVVSLGLALRG